MHVNVLVAEIGSTTTIVNAFDGLGSSSPRFIAQGKAPTTVLDGDVRIGLQNAVDDLLSHTDETTLTYDRMLASGSAAGGLRMTVHGLVRDMTVRAAEAAALGAGAIIVQTTAGKMNEFDLEDLEAARPNLILLAGGTDYGERETAVYNMRMISASGRKTPVIYCGNVQNQTIISRIAQENDIPLSIADNVYPKLDELNVESVRKVIHAMFEKHIVNAPGMEHIRDMVNGSILPTPGSVMLASSVVMYFRLYRQKWLERHIHIQKKRLTGQKLYACGIATGAFLGFISGAFGIGATAFIQLALLIIFGLPLLQSIGTCMLVILPISLAGSFGYILNGRLDTGIFVQTVLGLVIGSFTGAKFTHLAPRPVLQAVIVATPLFGGLVILATR